MKKLSMRIRITVLNVLLLTLCCLGLTFILNLSANQMANSLEAISVFPSMEIGENGLPIPSQKEETHLMMPIVPSEHSKLARTNFLYHSVLYMIAIVVTGGVITYYIAGRVFKPLSELNEQMRNLTVHTLSENLFVPQGNDEIAELTKSFNQMSTKLDDSFAMQKRFAESAAHELRTPLTVLKTKIDVFNKKDNRTQDEYAKLIEVFSANTNRLSNLVNDLLSLTNILEVDLSDEIVLNIMFKEIIDEVSPLLLEKKIMISLFDSTNHTSFRGNKNLLHRAFFNLVENAIKYNVDQGSVVISLEVIEGKNRIAMKDSGISIPKEMKHLIFEPFFRVDKSRNRNIAGSGLGLSTVKTILDKHHGTIIVTDNPTGGSIFEIFL